jgi:BNR repeat-like domain
VTHPSGLRIGSRAALAVLLGLLAVPALAAAQGVGARTVHTSRAAPAVLHVGRIDRQDVAPRSNCERDTLAEPHVAISPVNPRVQIAVAHDCRFSSGGAVDISYAWTHDGGAHWHHAPVPGLTRAVGGVWARASDPVVAFGPGGAVYISALVFDLGCSSGVMVSKSVNGGASFARPVLVHRSTTCSYSDDKNWLVVDTHRKSPFYGRLYQFWTVFLSTRQGQPIGVPQVVRWSDDNGAHWSRTHLVTPRHENSQDSQPMIQPNGTIVDAYYSFGSGSDPGSTPATIGDHAHVGAAAAAASATPFVARTSDDGGATWSRESVITPNVGFGPPDVRCCLPAASADPVRGTLYAVWDGAGPGEPITLASSSDGRHWSRMLVTPEHRRNIQHVNAAVAAYNGRVFVSYGRRNTAVGDGDLVQQELSSSFDAGASFGPALALGPVSDLKYAAVAPVAFPGDYIGASQTESRLTLVWCVSSRPANPARKYHQVLYGAVLRP